MRAAVILLLNVLYGVSVTSNMSMLYVTAAIHRVDVSSALQKRVCGAHATREHVFFRDDVCFAQAPSLWLSTAETVRWRRLLNVRIGCAHVVITCTAGMVSKDTSSSLSPSSRTVTFTTPFCSTGGCGSPLVSKSKRDREEGKKMLRSSGLVGPTPGGAEREDRASRTYGRRGRSVVRFQHFQYVTIARSGPRLCNYTRHHLQQNARQDNLAQLLPVTCRKITSECSSLCCCKRLVKRKNIRSGQASPGIVMGAVQSRQGSRQSLHSSKVLATNKHTAIPCVCFGTSIQLLHVSPMAR